MRIFFEKQASRKLPTQMSLWLPVGLYLLLIGGAVGWYKKTGQEFILCGLKRTIGLPCPGCRGTRAALSFAKGDMAGAWQFNPMATILFVLAIAWLVMRYGFGYKIKGNVSRKEWVGIAAVLTALLGWNWHYVIQAGG